MANNNARTERVAALSAAIFCLGLAYLFVSDMVWPLLLPLSWVAMLPLLLSRQGWMGVWVIAQSGLGLFGLAFLFIVGWVSPGMALAGVLALAGMSALIMVIFPPSMVARHKYAWPFRRGDAEDDLRKAKRHVPLPRTDFDYRGAYDEAWDDDEDVYFDDVSARHKRQST